MNGIITYAYMCRESGCGERFERQYPFGRHPQELECPVCGGKATRFMGKGAVSLDIHFVGWDWSFKNLLDPESKDPRLDPMFFDDLMEKEGPTKHFT